MVASLEFGWGPQQTRPPDTTWFDAGGRFEGPFASAVHLGLEGSFSPFSAT